jgi:predicted transposase YbfD/YdcC
LEDVYRQWVSPYIGMLNGKQICVDGKTIRGASRQEEADIHVVSAWVRQDGISLGQVRTDAKSNEITTIPLLLEEFDIAGSIITIDAMGCQRDIATTIMSAHANYIFCVKENQPTLLTEMTDYFTWAMKDPIEKRYITSSYKTENGHGRISTWRVWSTQEVGWFESKHKWSGLKSFIRVERTTIVGDMKTKEVAYYISSLEAPANQFLELYCLRLRFSL